MSLIARTKTGALTQRASATAATDRAASLGYTLCLALSNGVPDFLHVAVVRKRRLFYRTYPLEAAGECSIVEMCNLL